MRLSSRSLHLALSLALAAGAGGVIAAAERNPAHKAHSAESAGSARVIVKFKPDAALVRMHALSSRASSSEVLAVAAARASSIGSRMGILLGAGRSLDEHTQVVHASGLNSAALAARLAAEHDVEYAEIDNRRTHFAVPNDPLYAQGPEIAGNAGGPAAGQWYLRAPSGEVVSSINAVDAWATTTGTANVVVAVLDTGVRAEHPDLAGRLLPGYDMVSDLQTANDGGGRDADASDPGDWVTDAEAADGSSAFYQCDVGNSSWHGTMTSSLIGAASNNGIGMAGVAWNAMLLPVRVLGKCGGNDSDIVAGMRWAAGLSVPGVPVNTNPARIINMSLGSDGACTRSYASAISAIMSSSNPAVIVAAAGNSSGRAVGAPANCAGVIGVAGLRHVGTKVGFSDLGPEIAISAPGGNCVNVDSGSPCLYPILAATNTGTTAPLASSYSDSFNVSVGTSFSAPMVAGTVALMLSVQPSLTPSQVRSALQRSARAFPAPSQSGTVPACQAPNGSDQLECYCTTDTCGAGMLDAAAAVAMAMEMAAPNAPDIKAPSIPSDVTAVATSATQIKLSWTPSTDDVGVASYRIYRGAVLVATLGPVTTYSDTGLRASASYTYTVAACDAAGNCSARSSAATASTSQSVASANSTHSKSDCLFSWAEGNYAVLFSPRAARSQSIGPYYLRYYWLTATYLAVSGDALYYAGPLSANQLLNIGPVSTWYVRAGCS